MASTGGTDGGVAGNCNLGRAEDILAHCGASRPLGSGGRLQSELLAVELEVLRRVVVHLP